LKAEFHIHTVFSDGFVWRTTRVQEAWRDGLDVISLTDHLEYHRDKEYINPDPGRSYQLARDVAAELGILVVPGVEMTKKFPTRPAHFNALFVTDAGAILADDLEKSLRRAMPQGAFVVWNVVSTDRQAFDEGLFQGIEIGNQNHFYEEVYRRHFCPRGEPHLHSPVLLRRLQLWPLRALSNS
jgi:hypothetical protein